jgi:ParB-like chromosome segregation protein Spo0J
MPPHVPKPGAGNTGPRGVGIADGDYSSPITPQYMPIDKIRVGKRHRNDMGDLDALAANMHAVGLLQPIVVTPDGLLLCGERRIAAAKLIRWKTILVRRLTSLTNEVPAARLAIHMAGKFFNCVEGQLWPMKSRNPSSKS